MKKFTYDDFNSFLFWWHDAGQEVRGNVLKKLNETPLPAYPCHFKYENTTFCVDWSNHAWELGDCCVYAWVDDDEGIYYIGSGSTWRPSNTNDRTAKFKEIYAKGNSQVYIICIHVDKNVALSMEKLCIYQAQLKHCHLVNERDLLKAEKEHEYMELRNHYPEVLEAFDKLYDKICFDIINGIKTSPKVRKRDRYELRNFWEIDGVRKHVNEWCSEYNVSYSVVYNRIKTHGLTPKQALSFPNVPVRYRRKPMEYWMQLGLLDSDGKQAS